MQPIQAEALAIEALFKKGVFEPARVQRDYQWTHKECNQFLNDLEGALQDAGLDPDPAEGLPEPAALEQSEPEGEDGAAPTKPIRASAAAKKQATRARPKNYFLGPMVLLRRPHAKDAYYIYDGQQRFTTISILLAALRDHLRDENWRDLQELLRTTDGEMRARLRVSTPGGSLASITNALGGCKWQARAANQSPADLCMYRAAQQFSDATRAWSDAKKRAFITYLRRNVFVTISYVDDPALAHIVFETANTRGRGLSPGDILKGHLVQVLYEAHGARRASTAATRWEQTRRALGHHFDGYLRAVDFVVFGKARDSELGEDFLDEFDGPSGAEAATSWVDERLPRYLNDYLPIWSHEAGTEPLRDFDASFKRLSFFRWREWEAVAMALHNRDADDPVRFARSIAQLQKACMIMHLLGWHTRAKSRAKALSSAIDQIDAGLNPFAKRMRDGRFGALAFFSQAKAQARGALRAPLPDDYEVYGPIVRWLESLDWKDGVPRRLFADSSVEHVLPRSHAGSWAVAIADDTERELCKNLLGNLCLIPRDLNDDLVNEDYAAKRRGYLSTDRAKYRGAHDVAQHATWTAAEIRSRTEALASRAEAELGIGAKTA